MIIKEVSEIGSKVIRTRAKEVKFLKSLMVKKTIKDLTDSMRKHGLVGMAAPQIGIGTRIFVTEIRKTPYRKDAELDKLRIFINPKIVSSSDKCVIGHEGCGSVSNGGLFGPVKRPEEVVVQALDSNGDKFHLEVSGLLARVIQHEIDHLNGVVFIDHVSDTRKLLGKTEYLKMEKENIKKKGIQGK